MRKPSGKAVEIDLGPVGVAAEMTLVGIGAHLGDERVPFAADTVDSHSIQLGEIGGVEARAQQGVVSVPRVVELVRTADGLDGHSLLPDEKLTS